MALLRDPEEVWNETSWSLQVSSAPVEHTYPKNYASSRAKNPEIGSTSRSDVRSFDQLKTPDNIKEWM